MGETIQYVANNQADNNSYTVWYKVVKTSNGISLLQSDSYNILAISIYPGASWDNTSKLWYVPIQIAGIGATRSGYGQLRANGLKTITLDTDQGQVAHVLSSANLYGKTDYFSKMLAVTTGGMDDDVVWQAYTPDTVSSSTHYLARFDSNTKSDDTTGRFSTTIQKWQYSDLSAGDTPDGVYAQYIETDCYPDRIEDLYFKSKFTWSLFDSSTNVIHLRVHLPPDPTGMTEEEQKKYGIYYYSNTYNGVVSSGYAIKNIQHEVYGD